MCCLLCIQTIDIILCTCSKSIYSNVRGEFWGELGWFRIKRGENLLLIESKCVFGVPGNWTVDPMFVTDEGIEFNGPSSFVQNA